MLIYTRRYNEHSITEYLINSISIYQCFVCQDGLNRPARPLCAVKDVLLLLECNIFNNYFCSSATSS